MSAEYDLVSLGELQLRLRTRDDERIENATELRVVAACSEANVAATLAQLGRRTAHVSLMAEGPLTRRALWDYRAWGVDLSAVRTVPGGRTALYFHESSSEGGSVLYDREGTPFRTAAPADLDWTPVDRASRVFVTGVTAALSEGTRELVTHLVDRADAAGAGVVYDVNHRHRLWSAERARDFVDGLAGRIEVLFCSHRDAAALFDAGFDPETACERLRDRTGARWVVMTAGGEGSYLLGPEGDDEIGSHLVTVVDRAGAGDAFVAAALDAIVDGRWREALVAGQRAAGIAISHLGDVVPLGRDDLAAAPASDISR